MTKSLSPGSDRMLQIAEIVSHLTSATVFALIIIIITSSKDCRIYCNYLEFLTAVLSLSIIPTIPILIMVSRGVTDVFVSKLEYRRPLLMIAALSHLLGTVTLISFNSIDLAQLCFTYFTVTLSILLVSLKWKISIHTAGIAGPTMFLVLKYGSEYLPLLLLLPLVGWARVRMKAHTVSQLLAGALLAIVVTTVTFLLIG